MITISIDQKLRLISDLEPVLNDTIAKVAIVYLSQFGNFNGKRTKVVDLNATPMTIMDETDTGEIIYSIESVIVENVQAGADITFSLEFVDRPIEGVSASIILNKIEVPDGMTRPVWPPVWPMA